jgi:hypothetical protein
VVTRYRIQAFTAASFGKGVDRGHAGHHKKIKPVNSASAVIAIS